VKRVLVAGIVAAIVMIRPAAPSAQQVPTFRSNVDLVNFGVTVTDRKNALVADLTPDDFEVYEDGQKQAIKFFTSGAPSDATPPTHLGLLVDVSESMGDDISFTKTAAVKFLNSLLEAVDVTLVDFDTEVRVARYSQSDFARLIERIRLKKAGGWTALYDAIGVYLDGAGDQDGRKVMLLYTDGGDTRSSMTFGDLCDLLKASDVTVYVIGELEHQLSSVKNDQRGKLQQIADLTGGKAFFPVSPKELDSMYDQALSEIRAQYTIGYLSSNTKADGTWRKVEVKVRKTPKDGHDYRVRARKGYFAPLRNRKAG
jgi:Ca-activated chloride channel family protein